MVDAGVYRRGNDKTCCCLRLHMLYNNSNLLTHFHFIHTISFSLILSLFCVWESIVGWMYACMCAQLLRLCPTLYDPMDCSPSGSSDHGESPSKNTGVNCHALLQRIFPTQGLNPGLRHCRQILYHLNHQGNPRILEWVAYPFSRGSSCPRNRTGISCIASGSFTS